MSSHAKSVLILNEALKSELKASSQYLLHAKMQKHWGFKKLASASKERYEDEQCHVKRLIKRILFLAGTPNITEPLRLAVGATVQEQMNNDYKSEDETLDLYNRLIPQAVAANDDTTRRVLEHILMEEEEHYDSLCKELSVIDKIGYRAWLETKL